MKVGLGGKARKKTSPPKRGLSWNTKKSTCEPSNTAKKKKAQGGGEKIAQKRVAPRSAQNAGTRVKETRPGGNEL